MEHDGAVNSAQFSADGRRVVTASDDKTARIWDVTTTKPIGQGMQHSRAVESAQFSTDGQRVVTAAGFTARLWDAATGKPTGQPMQHDDATLSAHFSADRQRVVTTSGDTAWVWDSATGKRISEPMKHDNHVVSAQFSADGQRVVTASWDRTARLWDVPTLSSKDTAEDLLLLADLAEATGGVALQTSGQEEIWSVLTPEQVRAVQERIATKLKGPSSALTILQRLMKWSVADRKARTISAFSNITSAEWVENRIQEGTLDSLRAAMLLDPANARLVAHFGLALANLAVAEETDPDNARRARAEAEYQTQRALKLASDNDEVKKLRTEVVKLLNLSSDPKPTN